ncbi:MAG: radical SAM protein [Theionarchaea archaeon]|nr:radical SAM protein [Theionarchaea archaeon]MBU7037966.1 radical SAM protein [Theionarchaea archaeon]
MCNLECQGYARGSCLTKTGSRMVPACEATLLKEETVHRLVMSAHLSRPEHYFSVYQSGCNLTCLKCHSHEFTQVATGHWYSPSDILDLAKGYELQVTYIEKKEHVTAFHGASMCRGCGRCVTHVRPRSCPGVVDPTQVVLSPQGWGPARNIIGFTGGDITCCPDFYAKCARLIKEQTDLYVLIETNGFGLTPANLDILKKAGVDSFWLDIKAFKDTIHKTLTGVSNKRILELPWEMNHMGFVLEVSTLYIPSWVEIDQIEHIAELLVDVDPEIPFTILAYFPSFKMTERSPTYDEMVSAYEVVRNVGLKNVRMGNLSVVSETAE